MKIALVVFDIAGTTVADEGNINEAFREAFLASGVYVNPEEVDTVMGYRKIEAIEIIVKKNAPHLLVNGNAVVDTIHDLFNRTMVSFYQKSTQLRPMPYAEEIFELLQAKGIKVALNTGFTRDITDAILVNLGWMKSKLINTVVCSDEVPEGRPHPFMIRSIMQQLAIDDVKQVVKVGDTEVDVREGRNAGCGLVVAVTTGAYTREQLAQYHPDFIIDSLKQLPALLAE